MRGRAAATAVALVSAAAATRGAPPCNVEAMKTVRWWPAATSDRGGAARRAPARSAWLLARTGTDIVAYRCIVTPRADGRWSGRSALVPAGWTIGGGSGEHRVCRYAADADGSGAIDANIEHPADYVDVAGALLAQNFLVVARRPGVPGGARRRLPTAGIGTVPHQP